jgi:hypothetical protein
VIIVSKASRRRPSRKNRSHARSKRPNPFVGKRSTRRRGHSRRSNPGVAGFNTNELIKLAGGAAVGTIGSKYLAQMILQGNNNGLQGTAVQGIAALALAWGANKVGLGKDVATGIVAGGLGAALWALVQQYTGTGGNVQGLGDPDMARFLGDFQSGNTNATPSLWQAPPVMPAAPARRRG